MDLPGVRTRHATVHAAAGISGPQLRDSLLQLRTRLPDSPPPVLFLTNDNMVRDVAGFWPDIAGAYELSWSETRDAVAALLEKTEHQRASRAAGCRYPESTLLASPSQTGSLAASLTYPLIAKPVRPLASFKAAVIDSPQELIDLVRRHEDALPVLAQQFIPGGDERIHFCALYLHEGRVLHRFDGRKLRSRPMGHTTVAEAFAADDVFEAASRFFAAARISGPASLELKRDPAGDLWVIEPTVGRTDFWIQVSIANGVNLPWAEYCDVVGLAPPARAATKPHIWVNTERDPKALVMVLRGMLTNRIARRRISLPYFCSADVMPALRATVSKLQRGFRSKLAGAQT